MKFKPTYKPLGNAAILIEWPSKIKEAIINDIINFENKLNNSPEIIDTIIAYNSLTILFKELKNYNQKVVELKELYELECKEKIQQYKKWEIPVCYDVKFGLDLVEVSIAKKMSIEEVVRLHSKNSYLVYFLGFQPGFLYLGGLSPKIHTPRRATPRVRVEKGSVGIGGEQTGVYPSDNAGGWNIIGKSPIDFFNIENEQPCFARAGDRIQFFPVSFSQFYQIEKEVVKGSYKLKFQVV